MYYECFRFSEAIEILNIDRDQALACLKDCGQPIEKDSDILTDSQMEVLYEIVSKKLIIGMNTHKVLSRAELKERLVEISKSPTEHPFFDGAMCYSPACGIDVEIEHKCQTCGKIHRYKGDGRRTVSPRNGREYVYIELPPLPKSRPIIDFDEPPLPKSIPTSTRNGREYAYIYAPDRYAKDEEKIDRYVEEIRSLGYSVSVEHMCESCYEKKYGKSEKGISINVLHFKHSDDNTTVTSIVSDSDCHVLAEFLKGNSAFKGYSDQTVWINKYRNVVERLIGIKTEE